MRNSFRKRLTSLVENMQMERGQDFHLQLSDEDLKMKINVGSFCGFFNGCFL